MSDEQLARLITSWLAIMRAGLTRDQIELALGPSGVRLWEVFHRA